MHTADISCKFNDRNLHTKTNTKVRDLSGSGIFCSSDHTFDTTITKTTRYNDSLCIGKNFISIFFI